MASEKTAQTFATAYEPAVAAVSGSGGMKMSATINGPDSAARSAEIDARVLGEHEENE